MNDPQLDKATTDQERRQILKRRLEVAKERRVEMVRMRMLKRAADRKLANHATVRIVIPVSPDIAERAKRGCMATEQIELISWLRQAVLSFADLVQPRERQPSELDEEDREWQALIAELGESIDPGDGLTVTEILDCLDWPEAARNRSALMRVGRIMRRLRWGITRGARDGKRGVLIYRKPLAGPGTT